LWIGEVAAKSGVSRKALRLYESAGIVVPSSRTASGYRVYGDDAIGVLAFVTRARRLGFSLAEITAIVAVKRAGEMPCRHVRSLVRDRVADLDRTIDELSALRARLRTLLGRWRSREGGTAAICPHIESRAAHERRTGDGANDGLSLPGVRALSRSRRPRR